MLYKLTVACMVELRKRGSYCLILLCLSLYIFHQGYWPYALEMLEREYSQIF